MRWFVFIYFIFANSVLMNIMKSCQLTFLLKGVREDEQQVRERHVSSFVGAEGSSTSCQVMPHCHFQHFKKLLLLKKKRTQTARLKRPKKEHNTEEENLRRVSLFRPNNGIGTLYARIKSNDSHPGHWQKYLAAEDCLSAPQVGPNTNNNCTWRNQSQTTLSLNRFMNITRWAWIWLSLDQWMSMTQRMLQVCNILRIRHIKTPKSLGWQVQVINERPETPTNNWEVFVHSMALLPLSILVESFSFLFTFSVFLWAIQFLNR